MNYKLLASIGFCIDCLGVALAISLLVSTTKAFGSSGDQKNTGASGTLELSGKRSVGMTRTIVEDNGRVRKKIVDQSGTKPVRILGGSTASKGSSVSNGASVSTSIKSTGSGTKANSLALYSEKALKNYNRAVQLHQAGFFDDAIAEYEAAILSDDRLAEAYTNLGTIYVAKQDYKKAIKFLSKSHDLRPDSAVTLNAYAGALFNEGMKEQAVEMWKRVIKVDPAFSSAYPNLADALEDMGRFDEAKKIRDHAPGLKRKAATPVELSPVGDFENGEIPLQYKRKNR